MTACVHITQGKTLRLDQSRLAKIDRQYSALYHDPFARHLAGVAASWSPVGWTPRLGP